VDQRDAATTGETIAAPNIERKLVQNASSFSVRRRATADTPEALKPPSC